VRLIGSLGLTNFLLALGQFLSKVDPQHRDVKWQLERMIVFGQGHFKRSISAAIGTEDHETLLWDRMMSLWNCDHETEYGESLELLLGINAAGY